MCLCAMSDNPECQLQQSQLLGQLTGKSFLIWTAAIAAASWGAGRLLSSQIYWARVNGQLALRVVFGSAVNWQC